MHARFIRNAVNTGREHGYYVAKSLSSVWVKPSMDTYCEYRNVYSFIMISDNFTWSATSTLPSPVKSPIIPLISISEVTMSEFSKPAFDA